MPPPPAKTRTLAQARCGGGVGLFERTRGSQQPRPTGVGPRTVDARLYEGDEDLEVVGEASYQDALWSICGGRPGDSVRHGAIAALVPEPDNLYDPHAIVVQIGGHVVGYLPRSTAREYGPGLRRLMADSGAVVALRAVIVGGGYYSDGPGRLGVWLTHDASDFGVQPAMRRGAAAAGRGSTRQDGMRTGFSEAWQTDIEDDSYDLSWYETLPHGDRDAIAVLRTLLATDPDPIDRHFQFAELETRLYRCRDLYETALAEFDECCQRHDAEMETICAAFHAKWGKVPMLETYRQMAIRRQKQKDWRACLWWAERGLELYGNAAARQDAVEDLLKRRNRALAKLEAAGEGP